MQNSALFYSSNLLISVHSTLSIFQSHLCTTKSHIKVSAPVIALNKLPKLINATEAPKGDGTLEKCCRESHSCESTTISF